MYYYVQTQTLTCSFAFRVSLTLALVIEYKGLFMVQVHVDQQTSPTQGPGPLWRLACPHHIALSHPGPCSSYYSTVAAQGVSDQATIEVCFPVFA